MKPSAKIFVAGHRGLVGSAIVRELQKQGYSNLMLKTHAELDLCDEQAVAAFFDRERPEGVVIAAAKVGGIVANMTQQADFLYANLQIQNNIIWNAHRTGVKKLLFLGSSCMYPRLSPQPIKEEYLLTGPLEPTNEGYAIAKIAGLKLCEYLRTQQERSFTSAIPCNMYGPNDNFHPDHSHVHAGLIRRIHEAKEQGAPEVVVWGTGSPRREFLYVDDLAEAIVFLLREYEGPFINVGTGTDISIKELAEMLCDIIGFKGSLVFDSSKPDGMPRKVMDVSAIRKLGWKPKVSLEEGMRRTYDWYKENASTSR